jgi:hypothetical protein
MIPCSEGTTLLPECINFVLFYMQDNKHAEIILNSTLDTWK